MILERLHKLWIDGLYRVGLRARSLVAACDFLDGHYEPLVKALRVAGKETEAEDLRREWATKLRLTQDRLHLENTRALLRRAMRLQVPVPPRPQQPGVERNDHWRVSEVGIVLTGRGFKEVRTEIRAELAAQQQRWLTWVPLVSALAGLIGTVIGLISVLKN